MLYASGAHARTLILHWTVLQPSLAMYFLIGRRIRACRIVQCETSGSRVRTEVKTNQITALYMQIISPHFQRFGESMLSLHYKTIPLEILRRFRARATIHSPVEPGRITRRLGVSKLCQCSLEVKFNAESLYYLTSEQSCPFQYF